MTNSIKIIIIATIIHIAAIVYGIINGYWDAVILAIILLGSSLIYYFNKYKNIWHHGDFIRFSKKGNIKIFGRSDATLNPGGVRIGTSEIYRIVEKINEISDSLVVGQSWKGDQRILLFLKMEQNKPFNETIVKKVKNLIKTEGSPRHVPEIVLETEEIPYTINGKKVEIAVKKIIEGISIDNIESLKNPKALIHYKDIPELQS